MLKYEQRGNVSAEPIGGYPAWLSTIMRARGIDTEEKAKRFLHPSLEDLHDPMLMQDMDKTVSLLREAAVKQWYVVVYGDYDADGVCATSIMMETLREIGADVHYRIPSRHQEGYGLNCQAVTDIAEQCGQLEKQGLLLTVDCGITNLEEVHLARKLGLRVIVTDHHEIGEQLPDADAVMNPLLGNYPFRRLCGAGVALKITQALLGIEGVKRRIELAAIATVADIVLLADENRVIVREGLNKLSATERPGLRTMLQLATVDVPVTAQNIAFRIAPRINAAGRLGDASRAVELLLTVDEGIAEQLAQELEDNNSVRQEMQKRVTQEAEARVATDVDFYNDRAIIIAGQGWNHGIIGLAAGKLQERYHFPTIVLSESEQGQAVGSCRSIPGVDIFAALSACKDLFVRFGGHEQAAGLTIRKELIPELRRRLNLSIEEQLSKRSSGAYHAETCYIPRCEYDAVLDFDNIDEALIDQLDMLEPTGEGNPAPVFRTTDASVQTARVIGKDMSHLKLTLLQTDRLMDSVGFSMGHLAEQSLRQVDVLYSPQFNTFRGQTRIQLMLTSLRPAEGNLPLPAEYEFSRLLLQEIEQLAEKNIKIKGSAENVPLIRIAELPKLATPGRGLLMIGHEPERVRQAAMHAVSAGILPDVAAGYVRDGRAFNTICLHPDTDQLKDIWQTIVLLDGDMLPGEAEQIRQKCPRAQLVRLESNVAFTELLRQLRIEREREMASVYRAAKFALQQMGPISVLAIAGYSAEPVKVSPMQVMTALTIFRRLGLIQLNWEPFTLTMLKGEGKRAEDDAVYRYLHEIAL